MLLHMGWACCRVYPLRYRHPSKMQLEICCSIEYADITHAWRFPSTFLGNLLPAPILAPPPPRMPLHICDNYSHCHLVCQASQWTLWPRIATHTHTSMSLTGSVS